MVVAIQKGLVNMKQGLRNLGYDVVDYGDYKHPVDALVYVGSSDGLVMGVMGVSNAGVFLVNAEGKSPSEVDKILKRRLYTPLF